MSLAYQPLTEVFDKFLLGYFANEVSGLSCQILTPLKEVVFSFGEAAKIPVLSESVIKEASHTPLPLELENGRVVGLFSKEQCLGYAVVAAKTEKELQAADHFFQLLAYSIARQTDRDELQFNNEYLKNMISLMQRMAKKTAAVFDQIQVAEFFLKECEQLFAAKSGAVLLFEKEQKLCSILTSNGLMFSDFESVCEVRSTKKLAVTNTNRTIKLCVPLFGANELIGALYLSDREIGPFSVEEQKMAQTMAAVLGATIASIQLHCDLVTNEQIKSNLGRYLSPNLVKEIVESGQFQKLGGKKMRVAILFADIRGFTKLSEKISPEQMVGQLNEYFEEMTGVIFAHDGTLDKFVGDMIMVLFGAPKTMPDSAVRAVNTAIEMQKKVKALNERWRKKGLVEFGVGIGINIGDVIFGNIGSSQAMGLTVIGEKVNQAQRLEAYAKGGEILISESVYIDLQKEKNKIPTTTLGPVEVKGMQIQAYKVNQQ